MIKIEKLKPEDCAAVSDLHLRYYPCHFQHTPGKKMLECYYKSVAKEIGSAGFTAKDGDKVAGYICGVWNKKELNKHLIRKYYLSLASWGIVHTILHPFSIVQILNKLQRGNELIKKEGYELRPIIVDEAYQGQGVADRLVSRLVDDASERGFQSIFLITEKENVKAQKFYSKMRFIFQKYFSYGKREFCLFEMDIQQQDEPISLSEKSFLNT